MKACLENELNIEALKREWRKIHNISLTFNFIIVSLHEYALSWKKTSNKTGELYTGCNRRNGPDFGRVFLKSNYNDITQNTYIQS